MVLPALFAGIGSALSNPTFLSIVGSLLPGVVSSLTGSPTEDEAKAKVKPQHDEMVGKLVAEGMDPEKAAQLADQSVSDEVNRLMQEGGVPPWLEGALTVAGGLGGFKAGSWLRSRVPAAKAAAAAPAIEQSGAAAASAAKAGSPQAVIDESGPTLTSPFVKPVRDPSARMTGGTQTNQRTLTPEDLPTADMSSPFAPPARPMDPLTGVPRAPSGPIDPLTGVPRAEAPVQPAAVESPFFRRDPLTGGKAYDTGEQRAFAAADLNAQRDAELRRATMDAVDHVDAGLKPRQMAAMRELDERQRRAQFDQNFPYQGD